MTRFEPNLRIPGPTALPPSVREAGGRQMVNHRGDEFKALLQRVDEGMQPFFGTDDDVIMLDLRRDRRPRGGDRQHALAGRPRSSAVTMGAFGDRFATIAETYGAAVDAARGRLGPGRRSRRGPRGRGRDPGLKAVLLTHNETSTGVTNDLAPLAAAVRDAAPDALVLVDAISALGAVPFAMDAWGLDLVVTGSQKAWMAAPGMAMARPRAPRLGRHRDRARCPASTSTCGAIATRPSAARRRGRPPSRSCTRSTRACG